MVQVEPKDGNGHFCLGAGWQLFWFAWDGETSAGAGLLVLKLGQSVETWTVS